MPKKETWTNTTRGMRWYKAYKPNGEETTKTVAAGKKFIITPEERRLNQNLAAGEKFDLFKNGDFVLDEAADETVAEEVASDVAFSDEQIDQILDEVDAGNEKLSKVLEDVDSISILQRFVDMAEGKELHHAKFKWVKDRIADLKKARADDLVEAYESFENVNSPRTRGTERSAAVRPK